MAKFKVGDRVRIKWQGTQSLKKYGHYVGVECVIIPDEIGWPGADCVVRMIAPPNHSFAALYSQLEPLTPPAIDQWAKEKVEQVKKGNPEPVVQGPKVKA